MNDANDFAAVTAPDTVRLERRLPGPIERVWEYLTDPAKRGQWLATGDMELRVGGKVELKFHHADLSAIVEPIPERYRDLKEGATTTGTVTRCEPPHILSFTWQGPSEVSFELTPQGGEILLVLTHRRLPNRDEMVSVASGWHTHLGILQDRLTGREARPFWSTHAKVEAEYQKAIPGA